jgi:cytosine/uracil/thiamine/allantoin permease
MQVDSAGPGVCTIPRLRRLEVLLAIVVIAAVGALLVWVVPLATSGAEDAIPKASAGSAVIHDDAGNMKPY